MKQALILISIAGIALGCSGDVATAPPDVGPLTPALQLVPDASLSYSGSACDHPTILIDPGKVILANGLTIIKNRVFECVVTGDMPGTLTLTWTNAVFSGPLEGHVNGKTEWRVDSFFGRTDLEGTFEGPFSASITDIVFGEARINRRGTGDFQGLAMHGVFFQDPPGGPTFESGIIVGN